MALPTRQTLAIALGLSALMTAPALAEPGPGEVEVRDGDGRLVGGRIGGADAIQAAEARVHAGALRRRDDARVWSIVAGRGTYGDFVVREPNLTITSAPGARARISGAGPTANTPGNCLRIVRGGVRVQRMTCVSPAGSGVVVSPRAGEGGSALESLVVTGAGGSGIVVRGGTSTTITRPVVVRAKDDGVRFQDLEPGSHTVSGGRIDRSGDDGVDLLRAAVDVAVRGVAVRDNAGAGIEADHGANARLLVDSAVILGNASDGVILANGTGLAVDGAQISGNGRFGVNLGGGAEISLANLRLSGANRRADLRFSDAARSGGSYRDLDLLGTRLSLPGEPRDVLLSAVSVAARSRLAAPPEGLASVGRFVSVADAGGSENSSVTLNFPVTAAELGDRRPSGTTIWEHDPGANPGAWQALAGAPALADGSVQVTLADSTIASGSDSRAAIYAPLGTRNDPPAIAAVYPRARSVVRGRDLLVAGLAVDDGPITSRSWRLVVDGKTRGGARQVGNEVRYRVRLRPGVHRARLVVTDDAGQTAVNEWRFRVRNVRPTIRRRAALPRPNSFKLSRGRVIVSVPVSDDQSLRPRQVQMFVNGRRTAAKLRPNGRLRAVVRLPQGLHRVVVVVRDRDGARHKQGWRFRTVRP